MNTYQFGPQTKEFASLLVEANLLDREQINLMNNLSENMDLEGARSRIRNSLLDSNYLMESLTALQFIDMYSAYYSQPVLDAALATVAFHCIEDSGYIGIEDDLANLKKPWHQSFLNYTAESCKDLSLEQESATVDA